MSSIFCHYLAKRPEFGGWNPEDLASVKHEEVSLAVVINLKKVVFAYLKIRRRKNEARGLYSETGFHSGSVYGADTIAEVRIIDLSLSALIS